MTEMERLEQKVDVILARNAKYDTQIEQRDARVKLFYRVAMPLTAILEMCIGAGVIGYVTNNGGLGAGILVVACGIGSLICCGTEV